MIIPLHSPSLAMNRSVAASDPLDAQAVEQAGLRLAAYIGPIARLLAHRTAPHCPDLPTLYRALAQELHSAADRQAFLGLAPTAPAPAAPLPTEPTLGTSLPPAVIEQATQALARHLGPISRLLVKRAQAKALDRDSLYRLLARELTSDAEREAFLSSAGVSPAPSLPFAR